MCCGTRDRKTFLLNSKEQKSESFIGRQGGFNSPIQFSFESPMSLFEQYINVMKTAEIHCIDIFGYSGELRFDLTERYQIKTSQKLNLRSWDEVWGMLR